MIDPNAVSTPSPNLILHVHLLWEPWRSDPDAADAMIADIADLGFNAINIEAKPWEELFEYYADRTACFYTDAIQRTLTACRARGLKHSWMGFWVLGENLDRLGISPLRIRQGRTCHLPGHLRAGDRLADRHYKLWAPEMVRTLGEHFAGLTQHFDGEIAQLDPDRPSDLITGCEFSVRPSFDPDGRQRYLAWLERKYNGSISHFNAAYGTAYEEFLEISPDDYWANFEGADLNGYPWRHWRPAAEDFIHESKTLRQWVDNQLWRMDEAEHFAAALAAETESLDRPVGFWLWGNQWKQFFQDRQNPYWWHCDKGVDPWRMRSHLPEVSFITSPSDCRHASSAAALSAELAIARSINQFGPFHAAIFLGQHKFGDVYTKVTPAETIATCLAAGATRGIFAYGYNGLDDGGYLNQMPWHFRESVRTGLAWFSKVQPQLAGNRSKRIGILFPLATMVLEPVDGSDSPMSPNLVHVHAEVPGESGQLAAAFLGHRQDILGWYRALTDAQYPVEFLHPMQVKRDELDGISAIIIPWCPAYRWMPDDAMEKTLTEWTASGGHLICGPDDAMLPVPLRSVTKPHGPEIIDVGEPLIAEGPAIVAYPDLKVTFRYASGATAIGEFPHGLGNVTRFGFHFGWAYANPELNAVAVGSHESFYPAHLLRESLLGRILKGFDIKSLWASSAGNSWTDIEISQYESGWIVINHSNHPWPWPSTWTNPIGMHSDPSTIGTLLPHDAAWCSGTLPS